MIQFHYVRLYLGIETVVYRLLQRMARMDMDETWKSWTNVLNPLCYACKISTTLPKKKNNYG